MITALVITVRDSRILSLPYLPFRFCPRWISKTLYLVLLTDADRFTVEEKKAEAREKINLELNDKPFQFLPQNCKLEIIVQKVCIETWFLGNRNFFVRNPQKNQLLKEYIQYFDISQKNPEDLASEFVQDKDNGKEIFRYKTKALFHESYLREIFKERGLSYSKARPKEVQEEFYLQQLLNRVKNNTDHLLTFQEFISFCEKIKSDDIK